MTFLLVYAGIFTLFVVLIIRLKDFPKKHPSYKSYKEKGNWSSDLELLTKRENEKYEQ